MENKYSSLISRLDQEIDPVTFQPAWITADNLKTNDDGKSVALKYSGFTPRDICSGKLYVSDSEPYIFSGKMTLLVLPAVLMSVVTSGNEYRELLSIIGIALTHNECTDLHNATISFGPNTVRRRILLLKEFTSLDPYFFEDHNLQRLFEALDIIAP